MRRYALITGIAAVFTALDFWTKALVLEHLPLWKKHVVIEGFFNLTHVQNRGAAFGFLNSSEITWQFWLFSAASLLAVGVLFFLARSAREKDTLMFVSLGCILGGAVGNFIDRVRYRHVIDFLDFYIKDMHWPTFNVADIAICVGVGLLLLITIKQSKNEQKQNKTNKAGND